MFLSGLVLGDPARPYGVTDDLESFLHVLVWLYLRFHRHSLGSGVLLSLLRNYFYTTIREDDGTVVGGDCKRLILWRGDFQGIIRRANVVGPGYSAGFLSLIRGLLSLFKNFYANFDPPGEQTVTDADMFKLDHDMMINVFTKVLADENWVDNDKQADKFANLPSSPMYRSSEEIAKELDKKCLSKMIVN